MEEVLPLAGDLVVQALPAQLRFAPVRGASLLARELAIEPPELLQVSPQRLGRLNHAGLGTVLDHSGGLQAELDADDLPRLDDRLRFDNVSLPLNSERDEPAVGSSTNRRRQDPTLEPALTTRLLEPDPADHRHANVALLERHLMQAGRVTLALALETRQTRLRPLTLHALEEALKSEVEVFQRRLADVSRDLVQPRALALLEADQLRLELTEPGTFPGQLVLTLRLRETPVVDEPGRTNALGELHALRFVRIEFEPVSLLGEPLLHP